jgi:hypothetical protein
MILPFSTQLNGKPTYFVEKILKGLIDNGHYEKNHDELKKFISNCALEKCIYYHRMWELIFDQQNKLHTIREDKKERWKPGTKIDFFINCRQKNMFRFAPVLPVLSVQNIEIKWIGFNNGFRPCIWIDKKLIYDVAGINKKLMLELAHNDGFDTIEDFFAYFNENFTGKLIHWTDLKY